MGNSNNLAYDIQEPIDYPSNAFWLLHNGCKKVSSESAELFHRFPLLPLPLA